MTATQAEFMEVWLAAIRELMVEAFEAKQEVTCDYTAVNNQLLGTSNKKLVIKTVHANCEISGTKLLLGSGKCR